MTDKYDRCFLFSQTSLILDGPDGLLGVINVRHAATGLEVAAQVTAAFGIPVKDQLLYCHDRRIDLYKTLIQQADPNLDFTIHCRLPTDYSYILRYSIQEKPYTSSSRSIHYSRIRLE